MVIRNMRGTTSAAAATIRAVGAVSAKVRAITRASSRAVCAARVRLVVGLINPIPRRRTEDHAQPLFDTTAHIIGQLRTIGPGLSEALDVPAQLADDRRGNRPAAP